MEDFILREIDRLGGMLLIIARRLGLLDGDTPDYSLADVKDEFGKATCPIDPDALLEKENPVGYLVETEKISDQNLEMFIDILFHSDLGEDRKAALFTMINRCFHGLREFAYTDGRQCPSGYCRSRLPVSLSGA